MSEPDGPGFGAKMMALGAAGIVLSFGLCGAGGAAQSHRMSLGGSLFALGIILLGLGILLIVIGFIVFLTEK